MEKEQNIASRAPRDCRDATNAKQVAHVRECSDERAVTSAWVREASRSTNQAATTLSLPSLREPPHHHITTLLWHLG